MASREGRRKSQVSLLSFLMDYRERLARRCLQAAHWIWQACLVLNPYALWRSDDFWAKCMLWYCALRSRLMVDSGERQRLLEWVRKKVTRVRSPNNLTSDWKDGIMMCALIEALVPGSCPRYDLLNPDNAVANADMAIKLIERHLGIKVAMTAEEMVECVPASERNLMVLLTQLKLSSAKSIMRKTIKVPIVQGPDPNQGPIFQPDQECAAKGMGLVLAVKGRKASFNIYLKSTAQLNIVIEIRGPGDSLCSERITNRSPKRKTPIRAISVAAIAFSDRAPKTIRSSSAGEVLDAGKQLTKIPFEYEVHPGKVSVGYIPVTTGKHKLSIIWQGQHIMGSPYVVTVDESCDGQTDAKLKNSSKRLPMQLKAPEGSINSNGNTPPLYAGNLRPDLNGFPAGNVSPDIPRISITRTRKLGTVTRRRVLRHIVKVDGKDMVIEDSSPEEFASAVQALRSREPNFSVRPLGRQYSLDAKLDRTADKKINGVFSQIEEVEYKDELRDTFDVFDMKKWSPSNRERTASAPETVLRDCVDGGLLTTSNQQRKVSFEDEESEMSISVSSGLSSETKSSEQKTKDVVLVSTNTEQNHEVLASGNAETTSSERFETAPGGTPAAGEETTLQNQSKELRQWFKLIDEAQTERLKTKKTDEDERTEEPLNEIVMNGHSTLEAQIELKSDEEECKGETQNVVNGRPALELQALKELMEICEPLVANEENGTLFSVSMPVSKLTVTNFDEENVQQLFTQTEHNIACVEVEVTRERADTNIPVLPVPSIGVSVTEMDVPETAMSCESQTETFQSEMVNSQEKTAEESRAMETQMLSTKPVTAQQSVITDADVMVTAQVKAEKTNNDSLVVKCSDERTLLNNDVFSECVTDLDCLSVSGSKLDRVSGHPHDDDVLVKFESECKTSYLSVNNDQLQNAFPQSTTSIDSVPVYDSKLVSEQGSNYSLLTRLESEGEQYSIELNEIENVVPPGAFSNYDKAWQHGEDNVDSAPDNSLLFTDNDVRGETEPFGDLSVNEQQTDALEHEENGSDEWVVVSETDDQNYVVELTSAPRSSPLVTLDATDADMFPSVERRKQQFEEMLAYTGRSDPQRKDSSEGTFWASPIRSGSFMGSFEESQTLSLDMSLPSRSQSQGSLSRAEQESDTFAFNKTKEFWERSNMSKSESNVRAEAVKPASDAEEETGQLTSSVRERMMFWENMSGSPTKARSPPYSPPSGKVPGADVTSATKWNRTEKDGPSVDCVTESRTSTVEGTEENKSVVMRLGSPGSEGTADSGVCVQGPSAYRTDRRGRSKSVPASPANTIFSSRTRKTGYGAPLTLIYRQNPLFSLDNPANPQFPDDSSVTDTTGTGLTDDRGFIDDEIPDYASILMDKYVSFTGLLENDRRLSRRELLGLDFTGEPDLNQSLTFREPFFKNDSSALLPRASVCRVYGAGVYYGQVGTRNHFQVGTRGAGKGCLTVSVQGPGQHDVNEVVVAYAGEHVYEIMYDVAEPGYYVISVKWSEWNIPESPFICKVTY